MPKGKVRTHPVAKPRGSVSGSGLRLQGQGLRLQGQGLGLQGSGFFQDLGKGLKKLGNAALPILGEVAKAALMKKVGGGAKGRRGRNKKPGPKKGSKKCKC